MGVARLDVVFSFLSVKRSLLYFLRISFFSRMHWVESSVFRGNLGSFLLRLVKSDAPRTCQFHSEHVR